MLQSLFTPQLQRQAASVIAQRTGLSPTIVQAILPTLFSSVLGFLGMGASKPGTGGSNPVLKAFLEGGADSSADLGDVFKFANRFLNAAS